MQRGVLCQGCPIILPAEPSVGSEPPTAKHTKEKDHPQKDESKDSSEGKQSNSQTPRPHKKTSTGRRLQKDLQKKDLQKELQREATAADKPTPTTRKRKRSVHVPSMMVSIDRARLKQSQQQQQQDITSIPGMRSTKKRPGGDRDRPEKKLKHRREKEVKAEAMVVRLERRKLPGAMAKHPPPQRLPSPPPPHLPPTPHNTESSTFLMMPSARNEPDSKKRLIQ